MKLIIGLGNPGDKYKETRHNVGWRVLDEFFEQNNYSGWLEESKFKSLVAKTKLAGEDVLLIKPLTYMNLSGEAVSALVNFYKLDISSDILVVYDDVDLSIGTIRYRPEGAAGTHNGMKSITALLGTQDFARLRVGIESRGQIAPAQQDLHSFVISIWLDDERKILAQVLKESSLVISNWLKDENTLAFSKTVL